MNKHKKIFFLFASIEICIYVLKTVFLQEFISGGKLNYHNENIKRIEENKIFEECVRTVSLYKLL